MNLCRFGCSVLLFISLTSPVAAAPTHGETATALRRACRFMHDHVGVRGGYVWRVSGDLKYRNGEGVASPSMVWVQPPGTPSIGQAMLDAYEATGEKVYLDMAKVAADALVFGQLQSGGWGYWIDFDPKNARRQAYRHLTGKVKVDHSHDGVGGWQQWRRRANKGNITTLDDDTTQAAVRLLVRVDKALAFKDKPIHDAARYALDSLLAAQYPNGGWAHNYDRFPKASPSADHYPVKAASYPQSWPRTWPNDWAGCYVTNDNLVSDIIDTLLAAHEVYGDGRYLAAAKRSGDFLVRAQMPDPQPAWAQQYDRHMHPVWARKFEPPAITGGESASIMRALMRLYTATGDRKYLEPVPRAIAYFRRSLLPGDKLARFYELKTNRPLYFKREGKRYDLTYNADALPDHYGFIVDSKLDSLETMYRRVRSTDPATLHRQDAPSTGRPSKSMAQRVRKVIGAMDGRGAWVEAGEMRDHDGRKVRPKAGVIDSRTFIANVRLLSDYVRRTQ